MRTERGAALVTAMLIVTVVTVLASGMLWSANLDRRRTEVMLFTDQALQYALGAEAWAKDVLRKDREQTEIDYLGEEWAVALPPLPIEGGYIEGLVEDVQGRFNLNNLLDANGAVNPTAVAQFERLLALFDIDPRLALITADWLDADIDPNFPDGAEDDYYTGLQPPYRTANTVITTPTELLAVSGFDRVSFERIRPFVTALPPGVPVNVNTTTPPVLQAIVEGLSESEAQTILEEAREVGLQDLSVFQGRLPQEAIQSLSVASGFFRVTTRVSLGTTLFTMYSLLERDAQGIVWTRFRSFGTD
jgi:general secretion pathway protein K